MKCLSKTNQPAGVYWLKQPIDTINISLKLKSKEEILTLPTFEEYKDRSYTENLQLLDKNKTENYEFKWQEKLFSKYEFQKYSDSYNCNTQVELKYHDMTKNYNVTPNKIFTYVDDDDHLPLPFVGKKKYQQPVPNLNCLKLSIDDRINSSNISNSMRHLFKSEDNVIEDYWSAMHIVYDNSEYNEDSQILYKQECILLSLYYNATHNYMIVTPDVNNLDFKPYAVENNTRLGFEYAISLNFIQESGGAELQKLLSNLLKKWEKKHKKLLSFVMPPLGKKKVYLTLEVVSACGFENDNLYIDYQIKIPDDIQFTGDLKGRTHTSKSSKIEGEKEWRYGHIIDMEFEYTTGMEQLPPKIFLEAISIDWWGRHRTEGYCYLALTLDPGTYTQNLNSLRPEELNYVEAESRRFFVGGCHLIKDLDVLANPQMQDANFRYVSSGTVSLTWRVISQGHTLGSQSIVPNSDVIKGAEAVLRQYKKAKATLAEATQCLIKLDGSGDA